MKTAKIIITKSYEMSITEEEYLYLTKLLNDRSFMGSEADNNINNELLRGLTEAKEEI